MTTTLRENPESTDLNLTALSEEVHKLTGLQMSPDFWSQCCHETANEVWEKSGLQDQLEKLKTYDPASSEARAQAWKILDSPTALDHLNTVLRDISNEGVLDKYKDSLDLLVQLFLHFYIPQQIIDSLADSLAQEFGEMYNLPISGTNHAELKKITKIIIDEIVLKSNKILPPHAQQAINPLLKKWAMLTQQTSNELGTLILQNVQRWFSEELVELFAARATHCPMIAYLFNERAAGEIPLIGWHDGQPRFSHKDHSTQNRVLEEKLEKKSSKQAQETLHSIQVANKAMIVTRTSENSDQMQFNWRFVFNNLLRYRELSDPQKEDAQRAVVLLLFREFEMGYSLSPLLCDKKLHPLWNDLVRDFDNLSKQNNVDISTFKKAIQVIWTTPPDSDKRKMPSRLRQFLAPKKSTRTPRPTPPVDRPVANVRKNVREVIKPTLPSQFCKNFGQNKIRLLPIENATHLVVEIQGQVKKFLLAEIEDDVFDFEEMLKNITASTRTVRADVWLADADDEPVTQKNSQRLRMPEPESTPEPVVSAPVRPTPPESKPNPELEQKKLRRQQQENLALLLDTNDHDVIVDASDVGENSLTINPAALPESGEWDLPADAILCELEPFACIEPADAIPDLVGTLNEICQKIWSARVPNSPEPDVPKIELEQLDLEQRELEAEILQKAACLKRHFEGNSRRFLMREDAMKKAFQNPYAGLVRTKSADGKIVFDRVKNLAHELGIELSILPSDGYGSIALHADFGNEIDVSASVHWRDLYILVAHSDAAEKFIGPLRSTIKTLLRALVVMLEEQTLDETNTVRKNVAAAEKKYVEKLDSTTKKLSHQTWDRISADEGRSVLSRDENGYVDHVAYKISHDNAPNTEIILRNSRLLFPGKSEFKKIDAAPRTDEQQDQYEQNKIFLSNERNRKYLINRIREAAHEKMNGAARSHLLTNPVIFDILNDLLPQIDESWKSLGDDRTNGDFLNLDRDGENWLDFFINELATEGIFPIPEFTLSLTYEELEVIATNSSWKK